MNYLTREVRFALNSPEADDPSGRKNSWACWPRMQGLRPFVQLRVTLLGKANPQTGYLCDIKVVDDMIQNLLVQFLAAEVAEGRDCPRMLVDSSWQKLNQAIAESDALAGIQLDEVTLATTPFTRYSVHRQKADGEKANMVTVSQQFEFSASHRLHCADLSDDENKALFGKCNHPNGHGHNYVVEVSVDVDSKGGSPNVMPELETTVMEQVIDRFDHKYLNLDVEQFQSLNPTVENIAVVVWELLDGRFEQSSLNKVRVYETPKTWADYSGDES